MKKQDDQEMKCQKKWFREIYSKSCWYAGFSYIEVNVAVFDIFNIVERYDYKDLKFEDT